MTTMAANDFQNPFNQQTFAHHAPEAADESFVGHDFHADMWASGPGDSGPSMATMIGIGVGAVALIGGAMYLLGGKPSMPTTESVGRGLGITTSHDSTY